MKHNLRCWGFISIMLASLFVFNGCAKDKVAPEANISKYTKEMREAVSLNINDDGRRDQVLQLIDQMESVMQDYNKDIRLFVDRYRVFDKDYSTSRQSFKGLIEEFSTQRKQAQEKIFDLHFKAVALMTKEEWGQVVKYEKKAVGAMIESREPQVGAGK